MAILTDRQLVDVPVITGASGQHTQPRATYVEPPDVPFKRIEEMLLSGDELEIDYAASYLQGAMHETAMLRGAYCVDGCQQRLNRITSKMQFGRDEDRGFAREREFPFRMTIKQLRSGGTCACGGRVVFEFERGAEGGAMETTEVERC